MDIVKTMAARRDHREMAVEEFEALAADAERLDDGARYELVYGKLGVKEVPDGDHGEIIAWLSEWFALRCRPRLRAYAEQQLKIEEYRRGRARPDLLLAPPGSFKGQGDWPEPEPIALVVEVTSFDRDAQRRDGIDKPRAYAETGIPVYLVVDRRKDSVIVHSEPDGHVYRSVQSYPVGALVWLPAPIALELDTEPLKELIA